MLVLSPRNLLIELIHPGSLGGSGKRGLGERGDGDAELKYYLTLGAGKVWAQHPRKRSVES